MEKAKPFEIQEAKSSQTPGGTLAGKDRTSRAKALCSLANGDFAVGWMMGAG